MLFEYMPRHRFSPALVLPFLGLLLLVGAACTSKAEAPPPEGTRPLTITNDAGQRRTVYVEVADDPGERAIGLSGRTELDENVGMLFVIQVRGPGFWMKDTLIPLSVAFINTCGEIVHIADMEPQTLDIHTTELIYNFGLEVNQGWFGRNGIGVGSMVEIPEDLRLPGCPQGVSGSAAREGIRQRLSRRVDWR